MKLKYIGGGALLWAMTAIMSCDDNTGTLGMGMLPDSDGLAAHVSNFQAKSESVLAGKVFAKSSTGYVGKFSDPDFGSYEASFLTELNCTENFIIPAVYHDTEWDSEGKPTKGEGLLYKDSVVAVDLVIYYSNWFGDSLNACRMSVYELDKRLDQNYYTDIKPEEYYNPNDLPLGRKAYSAYDTSVPDSVRNATDSNGDPLYYPNITFKLDSMEFGQKRFLDVYRAYQQNPGDFENANSYKDIFENDFKGLYIKNDLGDGTILYIDRVDLRFTFCCRATDETTGVALKKTDGTDSLYNTTQILFASTKEIIQANHFENSNLLKEKVDNEKEWTYIKSPAGIFTQITMPYDEIYEQLSSDTLNAVRLTFTNYKQEDKYKFSMSAPEEVLLIRKSELTAFFENNELPDNVTTFTAQHNDVNTNQYVFQNIARLVTTCINEKQAARKAAGDDAWDNDQWMLNNPDWDKVLLVPVEATYESSYYNTPTMIGLQHDLRPGYAKLKGGPATNGDGTLQNPLTLEVIHTSFNQ